MADSQHSVADVFGGTAHSRPQAGTQTDSGPSIPPLPSDVTEQYLTQSTARLTALEELREKTVKQQRPNSADDMIKVHQTVDARRVSQHMP